MLSKKCHLGITVGLTVIAMLTTSAAFAATEKVLHNFGNNNDGKYAQAGVIFDAHGNLYGTTVRGGAYTNGTAFELVARQGAASPRRFCTASAMARTGRSLWADS